MQDRYPAFLVIHSHYEMFTHKSNIPVFDAVFASLERPQIEFLTSWLEETLSLVVLETKAKDYIANQNAHHQIKLYNSSVSKTMLIQV